MNIQILIIESEYKVCNTCLHSFCMILLDFDINSNVIKASNITKLNEHLVAYIYYLCMYKKGSIPQSEDTHLYNYTRRQDAMNGLRFKVKVWQDLFCNKNSFKVLSQWLHSAS